MNTQHEITSKDLIEITAGYDGDYDDSPNHPVSLGEVFDAGRANASPFQLEANKEQKGRSMVSTVYDIADTFLDELAKAGYVIVKKATVTPDPAKEHRSDYIV